MIQLIAGYTTICYLCLFLKLSHSLLHLYESAHDLATNTNRREKRDKRKQHTRTVTNFQLSGNSRLSGKMRSPKKKKNEVSRGFVGNSYRGCWSRAGGFQDVHASILRVSYIYEKTKTT